MYHRNQKSIGVRLGDHGDHRKGKWHEMMWSPKCCSRLCEHISLYVEVHQHYLASKLCHLVHFFESFLVWRNFVAWLYSKRQLQSMIKSTLMPLPQRIRVEINCDCDAAPHSNFGIKQRFLCHKVRIPVCLVHTIFGVQIAI